MSRQRLLYSRMLLEVHVFRSINRDPRLSTVGPGIPADRTGRLIAPRSSRYAGRSCHTGTVSGGRLVGALLDGSACVWPSHYLDLVGNQSVSVSEISQCICDWPSVCTLIRTITLRVRMRVTAASDLLRPPELISRPWHHTIVCR